MRNSEISEDTLTAEPKRTLTGTMKAVQIHEYGGVDKLIYEDVAIPQPAPDEVLIRVHAAAVNPVDWKIREGQHKDGIKSQFPFILGWDAAGTIVETGSLITHFNHGDRVFVRLDIMSQGCYAEYAVTKASYATHAPIIPLHISAGVPLASQTAWMGLFEVGKLKPGQKVLIHGASGGVGNFAIQLSKIAGAHVVATTSDANIDFVKSLGADEVIDYKKDDFSKKVNNADLVFDTIGGDTQARSWQVLRKGGMLVTTLKLDDSKAAEFGVTGKSFMVDSNGARLREIASLIDKDLLRVIIDSEFSLEEVKKAHERSQSGRARGKIILRIYDTPRTAEE